MVSRIQACFGALQEDNRKALIPFITAGDPSPQGTVILMHALVKAGADLIELGVPFSDPMADGPVIQRSSERALAHGVTTSHVFDMVRLFRESNTSTPLILMGYLNPIEAMGYDRFSTRANQAGVDGILVVDMPPEESAALTASLKRNQLDQIFLVSPTTRDDRIERICEVATGFLYYISLKGVTGGDLPDIESVAAKLNHIRGKTDLPLAVGFGIKSPKTVETIGGLSDAIVIGSALIECVARCTDDIDKLKQEIKSCVSAFRGALDKCKAKVA